MHETRMKHADLVVFENRQGGRGVRVRTAKADALILVFLRSSRRLHGNPINEEPASDTPGVLHGRMILYGLQKIDTFIERMGANRCLLDEVKEHSCPFFRERLENMNTQALGATRIPETLQTPPKRLTRTPTSSVAATSVNSLELPTPPSH